MLRIENDGPRIRATNYWESEAAGRGYAYVSVNAGTFRLLLPPALETALADMATAREIVISRGPWTDAGKADGLEILFDDGSSSPYALHLSIEQIDRVPLDADAGRQVVCTVWTLGPKLALSRPAYYRRVPRIPWVKARA